MKRATIISIATIALVFAGIALFPMALAVKLTGLDDHGISARRISGTIWGGTLHDVKFLEAPVGTVQAGFRPLSIFSTPSLSITRPDPAGGEGLSAIIGGSSQALLLRDVNGMLPVAIGFAGLPIGAINMSDGMVRFEHGRCQQASGTLTARPSGLLGRIAARNGLSGPLQCNEEGMVQASLKGQSGLETLTIAIGNDGNYRARFAVQGLSRQLSAGLSVLGFRTVGDTLIMERSGRLRE